MDSITTNLLLLHLLSILLTTSSSSPPQNFTLFGTARINQTTITLTHPLPNCTQNPQSPNTGRIFYKPPIPLLNSTLSFSTHFSFTVLPPPPHCPSGEGLAFLITSLTNPLPYSPGSIGIPPNPNPNPNPNSNSFLAVEFDTSFDRNLNDINDNHVGIDMDSVISIASIDLTPFGIDLKSGKQVNSWVEYNSSRKVVRVWVGYRDTKPDSPVLVAPVDLFKRFHGFMYVGFSASNGKGSSVHLVNNWEFQTFQTFQTVPGSAYPNIEVEEVGSGNCMICFPDVSVVQSGPEYETGFPMPRHRADRPGLKLAIGLLVVNLVMIVLVLFSVAFYVTKFKNPNPTQMLLQNGANFTMPRRFKYSEIRSATKGFNRSQIIGEGVSAVVYKTDGNVAVKRFKTALFDSQTVTDFATMAGGFRHKNLMKLRGWCCERDELILVYDYMPNGSVDKILHELSFETRLNVLIGVSSALVYLHEECERLVVHRNVKSSNILLDFDFVPKLGGFGMWESRDVTVPARAFGYLAPEYVYSRVPTVKTDVYSFGVVVLEVATGRPAVDENGVLVTDWVWDLWEEKRVVAAADGGLVGKFDRRDMEMVLMVGLVCVHPCYQMRPRMKEVLRMLKGELVPSLPEMKPTVMIQSVSSERSPEMEMEVKFGGDDILTSWGTPTSHFSKV